MLEAPDLGNEDGVMPKEQSPGKPTTRRYSEHEKAAVVRMVRTFAGRAGRRARHGEASRDQLGYGTESVRFVGAPGQHRRRPRTRSKHRRGGPGSGARAGGP